MSDAETEQYNWQRKMIGVMVILLTPLSVLFGLFGYATNPPEWWYSISSTYYANSKAIMISIITIAAFFFCTYKGYDWKDRVVNLMSGIGLALLLVFPCKGGYTEQASNLFNVPVSVSGAIHNVSAIIAFIGFFFNVGFLFTKSSGIMTDRKKIRNIIYRASALCVIPGAFIIILLGNILEGTPHALCVNYVWWAELLALVPCGVSWLVKAGVFKFLNDK